MHNFSLLFGGVGNFSFISLNQIKLSTHTSQGAAPESCEIISVPERSPPGWNFQDDFLASQETESEAPVSVHPCSRLMDPTMVVLGAGLQVGGGDPPWGPCPGLTQRSHCSFSYRVVCVSPPIQRPNWKLTWAEETSVPKRGDKMSEKTKHQIHIFDKNYLIMITADFLNSHWRAEFGLGNSALKSYCEARL